MSSTGENKSDGASFSTGTSGVVIVVMGVSGSGKTTLGMALAEALSLPFIDADDLHSEANKDKMSRGEPLTDADRGPWLARVRRAAVEAAENSTRGTMSGVIVACSALKASYRKVLRGECVNLDPETDPRGGACGEAVAGVSAEISDRGLPAAEGWREGPTDKEKLAEVWLARAPPLRTYFVHPFGAQTALLERMMNRESHFMKANMLTSQLETLENPAERGEGGIVEIRLEANTKEQVRAALEGLGEVVLPYM
ncbi:carbohydrate kinase [Russula ochroleuca]|uniref:gluconokinase n=1 Tax=Russula ochroleuca TaxID=152965 RepID=A0A9P5TBD1_9AGAM|nr:carbohydrate kinase [Russula ochroleuca]